MNLAPPRGLQCQCNKSTGKAGIRKNSGCNEEKSPHARDKSLLKVPKRIFVVLLTVTYHKLEGVYLGPLKNMLEAKLYDERGKRTNRETTSNTTCNVGGHNDLYLFNLTSA
jgi:hypothetical protein